MDRKSRSLIVILVLTAVAWSSSAAFSTEEEDTPAHAIGHLSALADPDTVRTNLWLTEALMGQIVNYASSAMPAGPAAVLMVSKKDGEDDDLFGTVAVDILKNKGYDLYLAANDSLERAPVDYIISYSVLGVDLRYPEIGRTLGIWQRWVGRDLAVTVSVEISAATGGQLLFKEIIERRFSDRVDDDDFDDVESDLYAFTSAQKAGSGWQNRMEEIIVLGTLVGLIAVYFANTGN